MQGEGLILGVKEIRTVPTCAIVTAHTFCASQDIRVTY